MKSHASKNAFAGTDGLMGEGIDALFANAGDQLAHIPLDLIEVKKQIREEFEDEENTLADLAADIKANGVHQPILVRPTAKGYELVAGERRYRASLMAGLDQIPAKIRAMTDEEAEDAQLAENIHRKNLTQIEEAKKIQRDLDRLGSIEAVLEKHHKGRAWLSKILSLLHLPEQAKRLVTKNGSADLEVINAVKTVEKNDPEAAKVLVDDLISRRGKINARDAVAAVKTKVKPHKAKSAKANKQGADIRARENVSKPSVFAGAKMDTKLIAELCQTRDGKPLVTINGLPSDGADLRPEQLRLLAAAMLRIADDAEAQPMGKKTYRRQRREYVVASKQRR